MQYKKIISNKDLKILGLLIKKSLIFKVHIYTNCSPRPFDWRLCLFYSARASREETWQEFNKFPHLCSTELSLQQLNTKTFILCSKKKINLPHICWWEMSHLCPPNKCPYLPSDIFASSHGIWTSPWSGSQFMAGSHITHWAPIVCDNTLSLDIGHWIVH